MTTEFPYHFISKNKYSVVSPVTKRKSSKVSFGRFCHYKKIKKVPFLRGTLIISSICLKIYLPWLQLLALLKPLCEAGFLFIKF